VRIRDGPAAVFGDIPCNYATAGHLFQGLWEGAGKWMIRKSEDLPCTMNLPGEMANPGADTHLSVPVFLCLKETVAVGYSGKSHEYF